MKRIIQPTTLARWLAPIAVAAATVLSAYGQNSLTNALIAYWPMDVINGTTTPDIVGGYNFTLSGSGGNLPTLVPGRNSSSTNCFLFNTTNNQSLFYLSQLSDQLPINKNVAFTVNFWVNANATNNNNNVYVFAEDNNASGGIFPASSNPLWVAGMDSGAYGATADADMRFLLRNASGLAAGGLPEAPTFTASQGGNGTSFPVFDGKWHMVTITEDTNVDYAVYVDGKLDPGQGMVDNLGNPTVLQSRPITNTVNNTPWTWDIDCTSIGALSRGTPGANGVNGMVDDVAMWTRTLGTNEVGLLFSNGLPAISSGSALPKISSFSADYTEVAQNTSVTLRWNTANATGLTISPAPGDVLADSDFGVGSVSVLVTSNTTFTLTGTAGAVRAATASVTVKVLPGVAAGWNLLQRFDDVAADPINNGFGIEADNWSAVGSDFTGALGLLNVVTLGVPPDENNVLGEDPVTGTNQTPAYTISGCLGGLALNSESINVGNSNTLFFRVYTTDANIDQSDIWLSLGFTWHGFSPSPEDFGGGNGPNVTFSRAGGGILDMASPNGVNNYKEGLNAEPYSQLVDSAGLKTATVYDVWVDVQVNPWTFPLNSDGTTNQLGDIYSVYIKADGDLGPPLEVFTNYYSDVDYVNSSATGVWGQASTNLVNLFFSVVAANVATAGTNNIVVDDMYMSQSGYLHTVPVAASFFPPAYHLSVNQGASTYASGANPAFTLAWNSSVADYPNITYSVKRSTSLGNPAATVVLTNGYPSGGASGTPALVTTFTDANPPASGAFYWVTSP